MNLSSPKLFNYNLQRPLRGFRARIQNMSVAPTPRTHFVEALIGNRDLQRLGLIGNRQKETTPERLGDIDIETHAGKFPFGAVKGDVINFNKDTDIFQ